MLQRIPYKIYVKRVNECREHRWKCFKMSNIEKNLYCMETGGEYFGHFNLAIYIIFFVNCEFSIFTT